MYTASFFVLCCFESDGDNDDISVPPKLTYFALGTQPAGSIDSQICANIPITDDNKTEGTEKLVICASPKEDYVMVIDNANCTDIYIEDNDGKQILHYHPWILKPDDANC